VEPLVRRLKAAYPEKEVTLYDERFTSVLANRAIRESGIGKMARRDKAIVDRVAATIILQSYMESVNH
jgi:putative Holliday junction resolvase